MLNSQAVVKSHQGSHGEHPEKNDPTSVSFHRAVDSYSLGLRRFAG